MYTSSDQTDADPTPATASRSTLPTYLYLVTSAPTDLLFIFSCLARLVYPVVVRYDSEPGTGRYLGPKLSPLHDSPAPLIAYRELVPCVNRWRSRRRVPHRVTDRPIKIPHVTQQDFVVRGWRSHLSRLGSLALIHLLAFGQSRNHLSTSPKTQKGPRSAVPQHCVPVP